MDTYRSKDLYLSAYLYAEGQVLRNTEFKGSICWFIFDGRSSSEYLANHYWNGSGKCYGKAYADAIRTLKDIINSKR